MNQSLCYTFHMYTKIFLDSGDPHDTQSTLSSLGFLDGQTTNPSLVAKNPHLLELRAAGNLTHETLWDAYKKIVQEIHTLLPHGAISAEVYADQHTSYEDMLQQARELATWFPGIYVKLPITSVGLRTAETLVGEGTRVNMTLCFSQQQAAAVHAATRGAVPGQVFVSPFIGRLDDQGIHGIDLIKNILMMYQRMNSHVQVLAASIRTMDHLLGCLRLGVDCMTAPKNMLMEWSTFGVTKDPAQYPFALSELTPLVYEDVLEKDWVLYQIEHPLTDKGLQKFADDWNNLLNVSS